MGLATSLMGLAENGTLPDGVVRSGIRRLLRQRLRELDEAGPEVAQSRREELLEELSRGPIAQLPEKANEQHYEVPPSFFLASLGRHLKYSCCYWTPQTQTLDDAEAEALSRTCEHAELADGQRILELGCGWGSLTLWMAEHYPASRITAVSNSGSQRTHILNTARERGLSNVEVITADVNDFSSEERFDRVVSVEMFEHVRNHRLLTSRIADLLAPEGRLFVHIFCHREHAYLFEDRGPGDWMARHFFSGGMMPSAGWLFRACDSLVPVKHWVWDGTHYEKTSNAWLSAMDHRSDAIEAALREGYGDQWPLWRQRWRIFYMACAELFGYHDGREWYVSHYLFAPGTFGKQS